MRQQTDDAGKPKPGMKAAQLEAQRQRFKSAPDLFDYLMAARAWFVDKDAQSVIKLLPETKPAGHLSYLEFSRGLLRAAALEASASDKARDAYLQLLPAAKSFRQRYTLELALAMYDERHKNVGADFAVGTPIQDISIRRQILDYIAGPIILKTQATAADAPRVERETALYRLLARDLVQGRFKGFEEDIKLLPAASDVLAAHQGDQTPQDTFAAFRWTGSKDYICPSIIEVAQTLASNPRDVQGRLCLGDFFRTTGISDVTVDDKDALGGTGTIFSGAPLLRSDFYNSIIKDSTASHADRAYALFRAIHCYAPAHINDCGGADVPESQRKAWYDELKASYGDTRWAKEIRFYW